MTLVTDLMHEKRKLWGITKDRKFWVVGGETGDPVVMTGDFDDPESHEIVWRSYREKAFHKAGEHEYQAVRTLLSAGLDHNGEVPET